MRKIFSNRKGVSGAISGMFVVAIFALIITAFFAYTSALNNYIQVVNERNRLDWEQLNERIIISNISIDDSGVLKANVSNVGAVTAHLVQMWITKFNENGGSEWQIQYLIDFYLSPGETLYNFGSYGKFIRIPEKQTFSSISSLDKQSRYKIKLVTERGNVAIGEYMPAKEETIYCPKFSEAHASYVSYGTTGGKVYITIKNDGSKSFFLSHETRLIMISTDNSELFSLAAAKVKVDTSWKNIGWSEDSEAIKPGSNVMIDFGSAPAGIYKASLVLIGYGEDGLLYYQSITIGETIIIKTL